MFEGQELVFQWGDPGDSAYVIEEGCVEVLAGVGADQRRIAILTEGAMFGEVALLDRQPRTASVRALVPTRLIRIDRSHVEELLLRSDSVIQYLMHLLLARFRSTHDAAGLQQQRLGNASSGLSPSAPGLAQGSCAHTVTGAGPVRRDCPPAAGTVLPAADRF